VPPTANAGQYATTNSKPLLFEFPCKWLYISVSKCAGGVVYSVFRVTRRSFPLTNGFWRNNVLPQSKNTFTY